MILQIYRFPFMIKQQQCIGILALDDRSVKVHAPAGSVGRFFGGLSRKACCMLTPRVVPSQTGDELILVRPDTDRGEQK